ncbi:uncharacterized protein LOC142644290 [Castanea sativa]|uniref:uncharacterized protein LOC142644290 n=1 Tax=Castanea sativa TaxID=21020 RepID=UPI003F64FC12
MTAIFHDMMHKEIDDYVDDIVVKLKTRGDHLAILRKVFERCRLYKLRMNPLIYAFGVTVGKFLGFLVHQRGVDVNPSKVQAIATMKPPTTLTQLKSFLGKPFKLYLVTNDEAIGALIAQDDQEGVERLVYYVSRKLKDAETRYPRAEKACLALIYAAQQLRHYLLAHTDIIDDVLGELLVVALMEAAGAAWTLQFDGSSTTSEGRDGIVLSKGTGETVAMSFKLDFPCTNNMAEYEAYLTSPTVAREMGIKHLQVIGDSNLVVCQAKGNFALEEPCLAPYRAMAQRLEDSFEEFNIEHPLRSNNRFADALATLGSTVRFEGATTDITIVKRPIPVIQMLKEEFFDEPLRQTNWQSSIKEALLSLDEKDHLKVLKDYALLYK